MLRIQEEEKVHDKNLASRRSAKVARQDSAKQLRLTSDTPATAPAANWYAKGSGFASLFDMMIDDIGCESIIGRCSGLIMQTGRRPRGICYDNLIRKIVKKM
jgi:hypothetical protein